MTIDTDAERANLWPTMTTFRAALDEIERLRKGLLDVLSRHQVTHCHAAARTALAAAPAPIQNAPQPISPTGRLTGLQPEMQELPQSVSKREALVAVLDKAILDHIGADISDEDVGAIADALLADGWTRKREDG